jgi:hypothetical protein
MPHLHMFLPCQRPETKQPCSETSGTESQNKIFLFSLISFRYLS